MKKEIMLTGAQVKEFAQKGETTHKYGGITYIIKANSKGLPYVASAVLAQEDLPLCNFAGYINYVVNDMPLFKGE